MITTPKKQFYAASSLVFLTFHNYIKSAKTSELLEMMGFKNGKDFFVLDPNEKFLSSDDVTLLEQKEACRKVCEKIKRKKITIKNFMK